jgi:hypothetical protein
MISRARLGSAFDSLDVLCIKYAGRTLHYGSASALAVVLRAWSVRADIPASDLVAERIRKRSGDPLNRSRRPLIHSGWVRARPAFEYSSVDRMYRCANRSS